MSEQQRSGQGTKNNKSTAYGKKPGDKAVANQTGAKPAFKREHRKNKDSLSASSYSKAKSSDKYKQGVRGPRPSSGREHADESQAGDIIVVTIKRLGINGEGVGYYRRKAVFIDGAITNEVVKAEVKEVQPKFIKAQLVEVEKRSPYRIEPPCPVFGICGGRQIQHISYEGQPQAKTDIVREAFSRYAGRTM